MQVSNVSRAAAKVAVAEGPRVISVFQNHFPGKSGNVTERPHLTQLGSNWAAEPKTVKVNGRTFAVQHIASRGAPMNSYRVCMGVLPSGDNPATVKLANGACVSVIFRVENAY